MRAIEHAAGADPSMSADRTDPIEAQVSKTLSERDLDGLRSTFREQGGLVEIDCIACL
ncbi:MAG: hypothetical protein HC793_04640 [Aquincola sp.]|nr:hypothetical protein [Aquincola sp.]